MSIEEDVREIKTDLRWIKEEMSKLPCSPQAGRIQNLETWRTFLAGAWAVIALLGYCAWDYLQGGRK